MSQWVHGKEKLFHLYEDYYCLVCQFYFWKDYLEPGHLSCESKCVQVLWETGTNRLLFKSSCPFAYHYYEVCHLSWIKPRIYLNHLLPWCLCNRHGKRKPWQVSRRVWSNCQQLVLVVVPDFFFLLWFLEEYVDEQCLFLCWNHWTQKYLHYSGNSAEHLLHGMLCHIIPKWELNSHLEKEYKTIIITLSLTHIWPD